MPKYVFIDIDMDRERQMKKSINLPNISDARAMVLKKYPRGKVTRNVKIYRRLSDGSLSWLGTTYIYKERGQMWGSRRHKKDTIHTLHENGTIS